ncbi:Y-family DNA polymerase [Vibrio viridaestus]|uniref:DNA polymerase Y family protein n=1 Tax=Vibrio viridaestus TaxID=2487322 RepID=A0A3N9TJA0_9VIBR|nr:DNA polymerase Y family protein [Vibrio viridaestus]RQW64231.1 DNA polymerase Y family protein [Vibrio viridaestus]
MLWLYLHFPCLQIDSQYISDDSEPAAIVDSAKSRIVQTNLAANSQGIKIGMNLSSASAMSHKLTVVPYQLESETKILNEIAQWLYLICSDIVLFPPNGILIKISNMLRLYHDISNYWQVLNNHMTMWKVRFTYSTGFSPLSARLLARQSHNGLEAEKERLLAEIKPIALHHTDLAHRQVEMLNRVGIKTLADLLSLPMSELARRFNIELVNYVGRLLGQFKHPLSFFTPKEQFQTETELLYEINNIGWLEKPLLQQLKRLEHFALLRNQTIFEIQLVLKQKLFNQNSDYHYTSLSVLAAHGEYLASKWFNLIQLRLESLELLGPIQQFSLLAVRSESRQDNTKDLFSGEQGQLAPLELVSMLEAKLGTEAVRTIQLTDDPRPELSSLYTPTLHKPEKTIRKALIRPSFLHLEPRPLTQKVSLIKGPERIATGWWDGNPIVRDYFIAHSVEGEWLWVFRDNHQNWFVHGRFS